MRTYFTFFIFLFAIEFSFAQDLTATLKMPEVAPPGTDYIVEITVLKGVINSYIKFTQKLPPRFKATEIESSGGSFTFDDSIVKIIWFFPPAKNEFTFSYKVNVPKDASGNKKIGGKIYYFLNTNREVFSFEKKYVTIGNPQDILAAKEKLNNDSIAAANNLAKKIAESVITNTVVVTTTDTIIPTASISEASDTLSKIEQLPKDLTTASKDTLSAPINNAVASSSLPTKDTLLSRTVKTTTLISSIEPEPEDKKESTAGEFSYCVQLGAFKEEVPMDLATRFFQISAREIKNFKDDNGFTIFTVGNFKTREEAVPLKNEMLEKGFQGAFIIAVPANKKAAPILSTLQGGGQQAAPTLKGVNNSTLQGGGQARTYRVQIGAFKEEVPLETANKFFNISAKGVRNLKDNRGLTVYTVGDFSNRDEALILRIEMIAKGFKDAFIVAFENGEIVK